MNYLEKVIDGLQEKTNEDGEKLNQLRKNIHEKFKLQEIKAKEARNEINKLKKNINEINKLKKNINEESKLKVII